jgi:UDP-N-acetylenolpyruvoylglucosamine reductase
VIALMAEGKRRVRERFGVELEAEVQFLGEVYASALWGEA